MANRIIQKYEHKKPVVLIIEDDEQHSDFLCALLQTNGFEVVSAINGMEGIAFYEQVKPDIILTDIVMPNISGFEVINYLHYSGNKKPVIAMSAFSLTDDEFDINKVHKEGVNKAFQKPLNNRVLVETINMCLMEYEQQGTNKDI